MRSVAFYLLGFSRHELDLLGSDGYLESDEFLRIGGTRNAEGDCVKTSGSYLGDGDAR